MTRSGDQALRRGPVVEGEGRALQAELLQELGEQPRLAGEGEIGFGFHREAVPAQWEGRQDAAVLRGEVRDDLLPLPSVHEDSV